MADKKKKKKPVKKEENIIDKSIKNLDSKKQLKTEEDDKDTKVAENEDKDPAEPEKKKQNKQIIIIFILMVVIVLLFFLIPYLVKNYINSFSYAGLEFQKTKQGQVYYYSSYIPITNQQMVKTGEYAINLRTDPRKSGYIKSDINGSQIIFKKARTVYISVDSNSPRCDYNSVAGASLAAFLKSFAGFNVEGALDNESYAQKNRLPYANCKNSVNNTIIYLKPGNETRITKVEPNCYELDYKDCEILDVTEKFQLMIIDNYMSYLKKK
jgi:hypothetical protein